MLITNYYRISVCA